MGPISEITLRDSELSQTWYTYLSKYKSCTEENSAHLGKNRAGSRALERKKPWDLGSPKKSQTHSDWVETQGVHSLPLNKVTQKNLGHLDSIRGGSHALEPKD